MNPFVFINLICIFENLRDMSRLMISQLEIALDFWIIRLGTRQIERIANGGQWAVYLMLEFADELQFGKCHL